MKELELTSANFDATVLASDKPVLVDFWAPWCGPCRVMGPIVEQLAAEMEDVVVGKLNVDESPDVAQKYNILSIPTFIIFKHGEVAEQFVGSISKEQLRSKLENYV